MPDIRDLHGDRGEPGRRRNARLESLLKREIATMVTQELRDPRLGFITVTRCEVSKDLSRVTAFYTVFGDRSKQRRTAEALDSAAPYIQRGYAKLVHRRRLPVLRFEPDDDEERRRDLERTLEATRDERRHDDPQSPADAEIAPNEPPTGP